MVARSQYLDFDDDPGDHKGRPYMIPARKPLAARRRTGDHKYRPYMVPPRESHRLCAAVYDPGSLQRRHGVGGEHATDGQSAVGHMYLAGHVGSGVRTEIQDGGDHLLR